jgi:Cu/Ag efflux protein CusF
MSVFQKSLRIVYKNTKEDLILNMRRLFSLAIAVLVSLSFSTGLFAGETGAKEKMIKGTISKVDCENSLITVSDVRDLRSRKVKLPDVTLKLTDETKLTGAKECKEIKAGTDLIAAYVESDKGNVATEIILDRIIERKRNLKKGEAVKYEPKKSGKFNQSESEKNK